jgi:agmatine deiminase
MEQRKVRIGLIQNSVFSDTSRNLENTMEMAYRAADAKADIICLQELFRTPYFPQKDAMDASVYAETIPGESTETFASFSKENGITVIVPLYEKSKSGVMFNTAVVIDRGNIISSPYRKVHVPHDPLFFEKSYFHPGDRYQVYGCSSARIGVLICYDQWFPEPARALTLMGAEIIFYPTAIGWIRGQEVEEGDWREAWETVQRGHAIANGVHIATVNRVGTEADLHFWGSSFISDAFGGIVARGGETNNEVVVAELSLSMNTLVREGWGFLRNRRPETYTILAQRNEV